MEITKPHLHLTIASQPFHSNLSGLTGPTGVPASLNVDQLQLEHVPEFVTEVMNSVLVKKNKLKLALTYHPVNLTDINVLQMIKDRVQRTLFTVTRVASR